MLHSVVAYWEAGGRLGFKAGCLILCIFPVMVAVYCEVNKLHLCDKWFGRYFNSKIDENAFFTVYSMLNKIKDALR